MQPKKSAHAGHWSGSARPSPVFKIITAYEDAAAEGRAGRVRKQIEQICRDEVEVATFSTSFSLLERPDSWKLAVEEAMGADVIIVSISNAGELASHLMEWVKTWPNRELPGQDALVIVFDSDGAPTEEQWRVASYFRRIAEVRGFEFFCNQDPSERADMSCQQLQSENRMSFESSVPPTDRGGLSD